MIRRKGFDPNQARDKNGQWSKENNAMGRGLSSRERLKKALQSSNRGLKITLKNPKGEWSENENGDEEYLYDHNKKGLISTPERQYARLKSKKEILNKLNLKKINQMNDDFSYVTSGDELKTLAKGWNDDIYKGKEVADIRHKENEINSLKDSLRLLNPNSDNLEKRQKELSENIETYEKRIESLKGMAKGNPYHNVDLKILNNFWIIDYLHKKAKNENKDGYNLIGLKDKKDNLQALGIYSEEEDHIYIDFLGTSPWNLLKESEKKQKGSGTRFVNEMVKLSMEKGHNGVVKLSALDDSKAFYSKLGFEFTGDPESSDMILTAKNAKILIEIEKAKKRK